MKCCNVSDINETHINHITKSVKAWTVGILKCDGEKESECDAKLIENISKNQSYYVDYYRNKVYFNPFIDSQ